MRGIPAATEALGLVLDAAEDASPLEAVEAVTGALAAALGADAAFFLIADLSGRGLVRLSHTPRGQTATGFGSGAEQVADRIDTDERAVILPFDGGPTEEAVRHADGAGPPAGRGPGPR